MAMLKAIRSTRLTRRGWRRGSAYRDSRCRFPYLVEVLEEAAVLPMIQDRAASWRGAFREVAAVPALDRAQGRGLAVARVIALLMMTSAASANSTVLPSANTSSICTAEETISAHIDAAFASA